MNSKIKSIKKNKKVIVVYVLYPCSLYQICQVKITQQNKEQNDGTNKQQTSLIVKKYVAEFIPWF